MKKTISINIAGLIFYIEEDGYDKLRQYIASVHRYFSSFSDSTEIVADIEGRIAERFLLKQKTENKQAISLEDVDELMVAMGSVSDFEAVEEAEDFLTEPSSTSAERLDATGETPASATGPKADKPRFYRDLRRKILGGVASGIAHHYAVDPLWVRLVFLLGVFGMVPLSGIFNLRQEESFAFLSGVLLLGYIAMWIAFPGSVNLEDKEKVKKFYRDPEKKVLGGVASGLSSYFGVDTGIVRFIWVVSIFFFGTGLLAYIILWAIAPVANTLTEKMEMQGEPITLSNIESNIKRNLNLGIGQVKDSNIKTLVLLPFKVLGSILNALGKVFRELGPVLRVLTGILMVAIGGTGLLVFVVFGAALLGFANMPDFGVLPPEFLILKETPAVLIFSVATFLLVPVLTVLLLGLTLVLNRKLVGSTVWIMLAGLGVFSIVGGISSGLVFQRNFMEHGEFTERSGFLLDNKVTLIDGEGSYSDKNISVRVRLKGGNTGDSVRIEKRLYALGSNKSEAKNLASRTLYNIEKSDSVIYFASGPLKSETLPFRGQSIEAVVELPYHKPFAMTKAFFFESLDRDIHTRKNFGGFNLRHDDLNWTGLRWAFLPDSGLVCLNFPERFRQEVEKEEDGAGTWNESETFEGIQLGGRGEFVKQFSVPEFTGIELGGAFHIQLRRADRFAVTLDGSERNIEALTVSVEDGILHVKKLENDRDLPEPGKRIGVVIAMPDVQLINLSGANLAVVEGFKELPQLSVQLSGVSRIDLDVNAQRMDIDLTGASRMRVKGDLRDVKAVLSGACYLEAVDAVVDNAEVSASGVSKAKMGTVNHLEKRESGASHIQERR